MVTYLSSLNQKKGKYKRALDQLRKGMLVSVTLMSLLIKKSDTKEIDYMIWECSS